MDADRLFTETKQGFDFYHAQLRRAVRRSASTTSCSCPSSTPARWRTPARVTFLEDYVFRSKVTARVLRAARRDGAARDGAHVVRRPGHHAVVGRPVAQRVLRDVRVGAVPGRGHRVRPRRGRRSPTSRSRGRTGRTSCRRRTRSPPTSPTCTPSRSTSTASPTPRAPACSSSWSPTSASRRSSPGCATTSATTRSATPPSAICSARWRSRPVATCREWGSSGSKTTGLNTLRADFDVDADGTFTRFAHQPERRRARRRRDPRAPARRRHLRRRRRPASWCGCTARSSTSTGDRTEVPALQGVPRGKLILVNDDDLTYCSLRLDPESLQTVLSRIADIAEPLPRTLAWSAAWEMTRDGRTAGPRLRGAGDRRRRTPRPRSAWHSGCCCRHRPRWAPTPNPAGRATNGWPALADRAAGPGARRRARVRTTSWPSSMRCARRCCHRTTSPCCRRCWTTNPPR